MLTEYELLAPVTIPEYENSLFLVKVELGVLNFGIKKKEPIGSCRSWGLRLRIEQRRRCDTPHAILAHTRRAI